MGIKDNKKKPVDKSFDPKKNDMIDEVMKKNSDKLFSQYAQSPILGGRQLGYILVHKQIHDKYSCETSKVLTKIYNIKLLKFCNYRYKENVFNRC